MSCPVDSILKSSNDYAGSAIPEDITVRNAKKDRKGPDYVVHNCVRHGDLSVYGMGTYAVCCGG